MGEGRWGREIERLAGVTCAQSTFAVVSQFHQKASLPVACGYQAGNGMKDGRKRPLASAIEKALKKVIYTQVWCLR